jgi:hypothetical protein
MERGGITPNYKLLLVCIGRTMNTAKYVEMLTENLVFEQWARYTGHTNESSRTTGRDRTERK